MSVFNFKASRTYLLAYVDDLPKKGRGEITRIAEKLGVSTSLVSQVLAGEKSFTPEQANDLVQHLGLTGLEADYLFYLINYERAGTPGLQKLWKTKLEEVRAKALQVINRVSTSRVLNDQERSIYYSSALYSAIRLFTSVGKEGKSLAEVAERFEIARAKASEILNFLADVGLCERLGDRYVMGTQSTHTEQGSPHMLRHHSNWRVRAIQRA